MLSHEAMLLDHVHALSNTTSDVKCATSTYCIHHGTSKNMLLYDFRIPGHFTAEYVAWKHIY